MAAVGPLLILAGLGITGLIATLGKNAKASPGGGSGSGDIKVPVKPEFQGIPVPLLQEMATALQDLTVDPNGNIVGPVTKEAVQKATALAAKLEAAGFPEAAKTMRDFATAAAKHIPTPSKEDQIPLPAICFTAGEQAQITRLVQFERDPKILRGVLDALRGKIATAPAECKAQIQQAIGMLEALALQIETRIAEEEALRKAEEELRKKGQIPPAPQPGPTPGPVGPIPPAPSPLPPAPTPTPTRTTVVQSGDGFIRIMRRLVGNTLPESAWRELRDANVPKDADGRTNSKDTDAKGGIRPQLRPGQRLFIPNHWKLVSQASPAPSPTPAPTPTPSPAAGPRTTVVQSGDGFIRIMRRLLGSGAPEAMWRELRDRNVPQDADGRARQKDTDAKGGIKPALQPGHRLFVPESWVLQAGVSGFAIGFDDTHIEPKSEAELIAESLCLHLLRLQAKRPADLGKGKEDKRKVAKFETLLGLPVTSRVSPTVLIECARRGQSKLPLVMYWPEGVTAEHVIAYRKVLLDLARQAEQRGEHERSVELVESLKNERGQGANLSVQQ